MMDTGPTICLPHPLQNACPGCTAFPHPSQNMTPLPRIHPDRARELQNSCNKGYAEKIQAVPDLFHIVRLRCYSRELLARRPHKRRGHPATGRPLLSRENSSNGGKAVKTFWRNLMSLKTGVSSDFCEINAFVFNGLQNQSILLVGVPN